MSTTDLDPPGGEAPISVEEFAARARTWLADNMPPADPTAGHFFFTDTSSRTDDHDLARIDTCRRLQRLLFDGGFAGICVPTEYGGQGLTPAHQAAFNRELRGYDYPIEIQASTFIPCMAVLLEFGTEEQKLRHIPPMLRGEMIWAQLLSEPSGGSDAAGALTTAVRDGEQWVLNGSKIWTTGAWYSRLGHVPGPHQLGRREAPRPHHLRGPGAGSGRRDPSHRAAQRLGRVLPGVPHRRRRRRS